MKFKPLIFLFTLLATSCTYQINVKVSNDTHIARRQETVEIPWREVAGIRGVKPGNVVVRNQYDQEIPSQVIYHGEKEPVKLIFQTDMDAKESRRFNIRRGQRADYPSTCHAAVYEKSYGDCAWENDLIAYRTCNTRRRNAPAESQTGAAIDTWFKYDTAPILDNRYASDATDNRQCGIDLYKAGRSLGAGATLPYIDGRFHFGNGFQHCEVLDNGPIRTTVRLTYAPATISGQEVQCTKYISLDAGTPFNRTTSIYSGAFEKLQIALGVVRHDILIESWGEHWLALCEAPSVTAPAAPACNVYLGAVLPQGEVVKNSRNHSMLLRTVQPDEEVTGYSGAGWSCGQIKNMSHWLRLVETTAVMAEHPLKVSRE